MSLQYSGGTIIHRTGAVVSRQDWLNLVTQAVSDAGWNTISGTPGSGSDVTLETAAGNQGQKVRVRFTDPGTGNCVNATLRHLNGTVISQTFFANPGSNTWRVIATKFHLFSFVVGSATRLSARTNLFTGILYVPTFIPFGSSDTSAFMMGSGISDTDVTNRISWRSSLRAYDNSNSGGRFSGIYASTLMDATTWTNTASGVPCIGIWQGGLTASDLDYRWEDNTLPIYESLLAWGTGGSSALEAKIKGQMYDTAVVNGQWAGETQITFDGHTWLAITDQAGASLSATATLFVAVA